LSEAAGSARFKGSAATIQVAFEDIYRIDRSSDSDDQILMLTDGQRMTGKFQDDPITAKIAATGTPITFNLSKVTQATVHTVRLRGDTVAGLDVLGIMATADAEEEVLRVAKLLENGDAKKARLRLSEMTGKDQLKGQPIVRREQINLLDGVCYLREGQYEEAKKSLRPSSKATNPNIAAYASACLEVLKKFETQYSGKPLSDRTTFVAAGTKLADDLIRRVRDEIRDKRRLPFEKKGDYASTLTTVKKYEDDMPRASVFAGTDADDELLRLWKLALDSSEKEVGRIDQAIQDRQQQGNAPGARRENPVKMQREIEELQRERTEAIENFQAYQGKYQEYGFRIEDPDIHSMKDERRAKSGGDDEEGP